MSVLNDLFVKYTESEEYENDNTLNDCDESLKAIITDLKNGTEPGDIADSLDACIYLREGTSFINGFRTALQLMKELEL